MYIKVKEMDDVRYRFVLYDEDHKVVMCSELMPGVAGGGRNQAFQAARSLIDSPPNRVLDENNRAAYVLTANPQLVLKEQERQLGEQGARIAQLLKQLDDALKQLGNAGHSAGAMG